MSSITKARKCHFAKNGHVSLSGKSNVNVPPHKKEQWIEKDVYAVDDDVETKHCNGNDHKVEKKYGDNPKQTTKSIA